MYMAVSVFVSGRIRIGLECARDLGSRGFVEMTGGDSSPEQRRRRNRSRSRSPSSRRREYGVLFRGSPLPYDGVV